MSYRVEWDPGVLRSFADYWEKLTPQQQREVTDALDVTDELLQDRPLSAGESRESLSFRIIIAPPIVVTYRVDEQRRVSRVIDAHAYW